MVAITYDDGLLSHYTVARPMHAKYKVGGTFFVPVSCADNPKKKNRHGDRCDWDMLREMQSNGLEIANHWGQAPSTFALPFGFRIFLLLTPR